MPSQLFVWIFVVAIYAAVLAVRRVPLTSIQSNLGLRLGHSKWYAAAIAVAAVSVGTALLVFWLSDFSVKELGGDASLTISYYSAWTLGLSTFLLAFGRELIFAAIGEELFFRGLVGGVLFRRLNFFLANGLQALVFLLPHLAILALLGAHLWPLMIIFAVGGWLLGWLRYASGSIIPGMFAHGLVNAVAASYVMVAA